MKNNRWVTAIGLLAFFLLCLIPSGQAQTCVPVSQGTAPPWQLGTKCTFTSTSTAVNIGNVAGLGYFQISFVPSGTVSAASLSLDSSATGSSWSTGGIIAASSIGSMTSAGSYSNSSATTPTSYGQLTPSITGSGNVTVTIYGYINAPSSSGGSGPASNVNVTSLPALPPGTNSIGSVTSQDAATGTSGSAVPSKAIGVAGKNSGDLVPVATDSSGNVGVNIQNATAASGPSNITSTQAVAVTAGGASEIQITVTGTWTGTIQPKVSGDGTNYINALVHPTYPNGPWQSTITANGTYAANVAAGNSFEALGNTVATGTAVVTVVASPGVEDVVATGLNTPADAAATPADAVHVQSWPMGWNGSGSDLWRTAGIGNGVAATGLFAIAAYCEYLSSLPTLTTGQYGDAQCDANGQLRLSSHMSGTAAGTAPNSTDIVGCIYNGTSLPAPSSGQTLPCQTGPQGQTWVAGEPATNSLAGLKPSVQTSLTTAVVVKSSVGNVYAMQVLNGSASTCYLEFMNSNTSPSLGTAAAFSIIVPGSGTNGGLVFIPQGFFSYESFTTGISVGMATTYNGSSACGTAAIATIWYE